MAQWIKTSWYYYFFEEDVNTEKDNNGWNSGHYCNNTWNIKRDSLKKALNDLSDHCAINQYEIKAMFPIDRAQSHSYGQGEFHQARNQTWAGGWGLGMGWGITMTDGFAAVLQRVEEISQDEYDNRMKALKAKDKELERSKISEKIDQAKRMISQAENEIERDMKFINSPVETKGLMGKKAVIADKEFRSIEDANEYRRRLELGIEENKQRIEAAKASIEELNKSLSDLPEGNE